MIFSLEKGLVLLVCLSTTLAKGCSKIVTRREIRDLSHAERNAYFNAIKKLHTGKGGKYESYSDIHYNYEKYAHGNPAFFPWHRQFLINYEKDLQKIDPSVVLPYWDWSRDSQKPHKSKILSNAYVGGNGRKSDHCVVDGAFAHWNSSIPEQHCLKRIYKNGKITPWFAPEVLEAIIDHTTYYDGFRNIIEGPIHGTVHNGIGGKGGDMYVMYSPNDPVFYLHHAFIDMIWSEWQTRHPKHAHDYNGNDVKLSDDMIPLNATVKSVLSTTDLCYKYPRFNIELPQILQAKLDQSKTTNTEPTSTETDPFGKLKHFIGTLQSSTKLAKNSGETKSFNATITPAIAFTEPVSEEFITMNGLDVTKVREQEKMISDLVQALNGSPGFKTSAILEFSDAEIDTE